MKTVWAVAWYSHLDSKTHWQTFITESEAREKAEQLVAHSMASGVYFGNMTWVPNPTVEVDEREQDSE